MFRWLLDVEDRVDDNLSLHINEDDIVVQRATMEPLTALPEPG